MERPRLSHSLCIRIRNQHRREAWQKVVGRVLCITLLENLFIYFIAALLVLPCVNDIYNAWKGPFPMNLNRFRDHLEVYDESWSFKSIFSIVHNFPQPKYIQIELGENSIDLKQQNTLRAFYGHYSKGQLLNTFNYVFEPTVDRPNRTLLIKFAADSQSHSKIRYPYQFKYFSIKTLKCIVHQLDIPSTEILSWSEKSTFVTTIEELYRRNPIGFNNKVIKQCGILIGYLYKSTSEIVFPHNSYEQAIFTSRVRIFDTSSAYIPYISYLALFLISYIMFKHVLYLNQCLIQYAKIVKTAISLTFSKSPLNGSIQEEIRKLNISTLERLDNILLNIHPDNNYRDRVFIINNEYVIIFKIGFEERSSKILRHYYLDTPFDVVRIENIIEITSHEVILSNDNSDERKYYGGNLCARFPNSLVWLHTRLLAVNDQYRHNFEQLEILRHEEEIQINAQAEQERRLNELIEEEILFQAHDDTDDLTTRILNHITPASPRFIAEFRLNGPHINNMLQDQCSICLENFELDQGLAHWPCAGQHVFHFDCMLHSLRARNECPLCRHPVEALPLPGLVYILQLQMNGLAFHLFNPIAIEFQ